MARKLKNALAKYQAEQKLAQQKASKERHAEKLKADQRAAKAARTRAAQAKSAKAAWLPFEDSFEETIILVGEGDFSFSLELIDKYPHVTIVATSLDTQEEVVAKYGEKAEEILNTLKELEIPVFHEVDATKLSKCKQLLPYFGPDKNITLVFNFPHLGNSISDQDRNIQQHQKLVLAFFEQCKEIGAKKVVMSLFDGEPYESWQPKQLARSAGYQVARSGRFPWPEFPQYKHQLTLKGNAKTHKSQSERGARIYLWEPSKPKTEEEEEDER